MQAPAPGWLDLTTQWIGWVSNWVWGWPLLILLVGTGLYLSILLRGLQFR